MNGMELSRHYFNDIALPDLQHQFPLLQPRLAAGLVGNGSECFGYDDEISRDHDWGVDFFLWVLDEDRSQIAALRQWKSALFEQFPPEFPRERSTYGATITVQTVGDFYASLIGYPNGPTEIQEWRRVPEENFAMATNGTVFLDNAGHFSATRQKLRSYYPEDLRRKKLAARCMSIAQTGQYNLGRCYKRQDWVTYMTVLSRFCESVVAMVFLLNKEFRPYYKWAFKRLTELPILGASIGSSLNKLAMSSGTGGALFAENTADIDDICKALIDEMKRQRLVISDDWFLTTQGEELQQSIQDSFLRSLPTQYE